MWRGLVWKGVGDDALVDGALSKAKTLADGLLIAMRLIKKQLETAWSQDLAIALKDETEAQSQAFVTDDLREVRQPLWTRESSSSKAADKKHHGWKEQIAMTALESKR